MVGEMEQEQEKDTMIQLIQTDSFRETRSAGLLPTPLLDAGKARALLLELAAGQSVAPCQMPFLVLYYFIEGRGQLRVGEEQTAFQPGSLVAVEAEAVRSIAADHPTRVLAVQVP